MNCTPLCTALESILCTTADCQSHANLWIEQSLMSLNREHAAGRGDDHRNALIEQKRSPRPRLAPGAGMHGGGLIPSHASMLIQDEIGLASVTILKGLRINHRGECGGETSSR
jgi:hypothetical protein